MLGDTTYDDLVLDSDLEELKRGDQIDVVVPADPHDDQGDHKTVYKIHQTLLFHFSQKFRERTDRSRIKAINLPAGTRHLAVQFTLEWMEAGGRVARHTNATIYPHQNVSNLWQIRNVAFFLGITTLVQIVVSDLLLLIKIMSWEPTDDKSKIYKSMRDIHITDPTHLCPYEGKIALIDTQGRRLVMDWAKIDLWKTNDDEGELRIEGVAKFAAEEEPEGEGVRVVPNEEVE